VLERRHTVRVEHVAAGWRVHRLVAGGRWCCARRYVPVIVPGGYRPPNRLGEGWALWQAWSVGVGGGCWAGWPRYGPGQRRDGGAV